MKDADERADAEGAVRRWTAEVVVLPKEGVSDPEGQAILGGLKGLGFSEVRSVRAGRMFRVVVVAADRPAASAAVEAMCRRLLANPVIERYAVRLDEPAVGSDDGSSPSEPDR